MVKIKLTTGALKNYYLNRAIDGVNETLVERKQVAEELSPTDTREYITGHKIVRATRKGSKIEGANVNDAEDAFGVEFGFSARPVNWHKGPPRAVSTRIYNGVGAQVMKRTAELTEKTFLRNLLKALRRGK